jgi:RNA:NAD 2'-phosphotransferase (TPT1/KptA family)
MEIFAAEAYKAGVKFYRGNDKVWLTDQLPPDYLQVIKE